MACEEMAEDVKINLCQFVLVAQMTIEHAIKLHELPDYAVQYTSNVELNSLLCADSANFFLFSIRMDNSQWDESILFFSFVHLPPIADGKNDRK